MLGTYLYGAVANSFPTNEEKDAVGEIDATNAVERAGCAAALGLKTTIGLTQGEIVAAIRCVGEIGRVDVENMESGRESGAMGHRALPSERAQWGIRGTWDDDYYQAFAVEWVYPFGTNHLSGVVVYSQGGLAASSYDAPFVELPIRMAKLSNFMVGYTSTRIGVLSVRRELAQWIGHWNDQTATMTEDSYAAVTNDWYQGNFSNVYELAQNRLAANSNDLVAA